MISYPHSLQGQQPNPFRYQHPLNMSHPLSHRAHISRTRFFHWQRSSQLLGILRQPWERREWWLHDAFWEKLMRKHNWLRVFRLKVGVHVRQIYLKSGVDDSFWWCTPETLGESLSNWTKMAGVEHLAKHKVDN
jgi:hypothetical protein